MPEELASCSQMASAIQNSKLDKFFPVFRTWDPFENLNKIVYNKLDHVTIRSYFLPLSHI
jgi:hypothetical protein